MCTLCLYILLTGQSVLCLWGRAPTVDLLLFLVVRCLTKDNHELISCNSVSLLTWLVRLVLIATALNPGFRNWP